MKILVTGGAGFIGSHLVDELIKRQHQVAIIDIKKTNLNPKARFYKLNILSPKISQVFRKEKPKIIFHLAAQVNVRKSIENPVSDARTNILGTLNILKYCRKSKFVFSSSGGAIYGNAKIIPTPENYPASPLSPYGVAKLTIEKYLKALNINYIALRYANVYGPRQDAKSEAGVIAIFLDKIKNKQSPVIFGDGSQTRDYVYVADVVAANIKAMQKNISGEFNIGTGKETSVNQLLKIIAPKAKATHTKPVAGEVQRSCLDVKKAKKLLNWQPKATLSQKLETLQ
ncbi:MAG: NAD-dependent epimerase/dehydratase family protein [bacterium]